jgi:hypothetical protein
MMNLSHEYNLAREHVSNIDFAYLVPSGSKTFSTVLPPFEDLELPSDDELTDDGPQRFVNPRLQAATNQRSPT